MDDVPGDNDSDWDMDYSDPDTDMPDALDVVDEREDRSDDSDGTDDYRR